MKKRNFIMLILFLGVIIMTSCSKPYNYKYELDKREAVTAPQVAPAPLSLLQNASNFGDISYEVLDTNEYSSVQSIKFDSVEYKGVSTKVFAYLGYPKTFDASGKAPAVVLVHGGGGKAFSNWVLDWTSKGYVSIAIDTEGKDDIGSRVGYGGPSNDNMSTYAQPITDQWMFHAVTAAIRAHSILINDPLVDASRTGICGISWGGIISSTTMCVDSRFSFAIPTYIKGYLESSQGYFGGNYFPQQALDLWNPSNYFYLLKDNDMQVLWLNSDEDGFFSIDVDSKCYDSIPNSRLAILNKLFHSEAMDWKESDRAVMYAFANQVTFGKITMPTITMQPKSSMGRVAELYYQKLDNLTIKSATIYALTGEYSYSESGTPKTITSHFEKQSLAVKIDSTNGVISFELPSKVTYYYVSIVVKSENKDDITTSSKLVKIVK